MNLKVTFKENRTTTLQLSKLKEKNVAQLLPFTKETSIRQMLTLIKPMLILQHGSQSVIRLKLISTKPALTSRILKTRRPRLSLTVRLLLRITNRKLLKMKPQLKLVTTLLLSSGITTLETTSPEHSSKNVKY